MSWFANTLKVYGSPEELAQFDADFIGLPRNQAATERRRCFNALIPMPADYDDLPAWAVRNWGSKWDIYADAIGVRETGSGLVYEFETANSPPLVWVRRARALYPKLSFSLTCQAVGEGQGPSIDYRALGVPIEG